MAPDLTGAVAQEFFGVAWNIPLAQFLIQEGFPIQSDLCGLEELGQGIPEGPGSSGSWYKFQMENLWIFLVASGRAVTAL